jgi:DNA-binding transcriptional regulator YiaG
MLMLPFYRYLKSIKKPFIKRYNLNPQAIGEHIRKKRIESGLLQKDLAVVLNTCEDTVTGWESQRSKPVISWYPKIIQFLGYYPYDHPADTAAGLIERCRHVLGLSYEKLGKLIGVHGSVIVDWKRKGKVGNQECEEKLLQLLNTYQCRPL